MTQRSGVLFFVILTLICGVLIYTATRAELLYINQWFAYLAGSSGLNFFQGLVRNSELPAWVIYSLPDALWMLGLVTLVLLIWDFNLHLRSIPWIIIAIVMGLLFEIFQGFQVVPGTFDLADLVLIFFAALLPISFIMIKQYICETK